MIPDYTVCLAIDENTLKQLACSWLTWRKFHPELFERPWIIMYDAESVDYQRAITQAYTMGVPHAACIGWPIAEYSTEKGRVLPEFETQREKMVSAHLYVAQWVRTTYLLKIDTDAICVDDRPWPMAEWFKDMPAVIASPWGYCKAKGGGGTVDEWAEKLEAWGDAAFPDTHRLNLANLIKPGSNKIIVPRFCSWLAFYRTAFYKDVADKCEQYCGNCKLPVPSEDTTRWYAQVRTGARLMRVNMKRHGWTNISRYSDLQAKVNELCQG